MTGAADESKAERVAANGRPLGRGGVIRDERTSPSTPGVPAARTLRGGVG
jgi:hypothetical protein